MQQLRILDERIAQIPAVAKDQHRVMGEGMGLIEQLGNFLGTTHQLVKQNEGGIRVRRLREQRR